MMKPRHRLSDIIAEMEKIERDGHERMMSQDDLGEAAFFRLLRSAFTEFLEGKPWVRGVGTDYWHGEDSEQGRFGCGSRSR